MGGVPGGAGAPPDSRMRVDAGFPACPARWGDGGGPGGFGTTGGAGCGQLAAGATGRGGVAWPDRHGDTGIKALVRLAGDGAQPPEQRRTALEALVLKARECHDSECYSLLERIEAFLEEQLRADALDLLVVGQAGWAEHDHRLPLLQRAARGLQLAAPEVLPLFGSGAGRKLPMLTLRVEEETGDLRIRTEVLEVPVWQLPLPGGEQLELVVPAGVSNIGSVVEETVHEFYSPGCAACEVRHELSQRHQASAWSWLVHLDEILDLMGSAVQDE